MCNSPREAYLLEKYLFTNQFGLGEGSEESKQGMNISSSLKFSMGSPLFFGFQVWIMWHISSCIALH